MHEISQGSDISEMILKEKINIFSNFLCGSFNSSIKSRKFPENFKLADIIPPHKKGKKDIKGNYRPVSILPNLSKIFEKCILTQMLQFFSNIFLKYQCGFRKSFSTQLSLLEMLEKWKCLLTMEKLLVIYWRIYRTLLIALVMNYSLLN